MLLAASTAHAPQEDSHVVDGDAARVTTGIRETSRDFDSRCKERAHLMLASSIMSLKREEEACGSGCDTRRQLEVKTSKMMKNDKRFERKNDGKCLER
jgi:hypothetical protein